MPPEWTCPQCSEHHDFAPRTCHGCGFAARNDKAHPDNQPMSETTYVIVAIDHPKGLADKARQAALEVLGEVEDWPIQVYGVREVNGRVVALSATFPDDAPLGGRRDAEFEAHDRMRERIDAWVDGMAYDFTDGPGTVCCDATLDVLDLVRALDEARTWCARWMRRAHSGRRGG